MDGKELHSALLNAAAFRSRLIRIIASAISERTPREEHSAPFDTGKGNNLCLMHQIPDQIYKQIC